MRVIFAIALTALYSQPARADWQFTKWGMTPQQVAAAGKGAAPLVEPRKSDSGIVYNEGPYFSGDHSFTARYSYDDNKLTSVVLETIKGRGCGSLPDDLVSLYGKPISNENIGGLVAMSKWLDTKKNNNVMLMDFSDSCTLIYTEAKVENRSGL